MNERFDPDVTTGAYGDGTLDDEFRWAAAELAVTTGQGGFLGQSQEQEKRESGQRSDYKAFGRFQILGDA